MAIAQRQGTHNHFPSATTGTLAAFSCQLNDVIVVVYSVRATSSTGNAPTDTIGNTYTQKAAVNNGSAARVEIWTAVSIGSNASNVIT